MRKNTIIYSLIALFIASSACDEVMPTQDVVIYDETKLPTITLREELPETAPVESTLEIKAKLEAFNGIDSIFLNGDLVRVFGNGQISYEASIPFLMPDQDSVKLQIRVKDELGLSTYSEEYVVKAAGRLPSPFLLCDFAQGNAEFIETSDARHIDFPLADIAQNTADGKPTYSDNIGWYEVATESSQEDISKVLLGGVSMNTVNNQDKWPYVNTYGAQAPLMFGEENTAMCVRHHFIDVAPDGNVGLTKWKPITPYFMNKLYFGTNINNILIADIIEERRVVKLDIYVDTEHTNETNPDAQFDFDLSKHGLVVIGLANSAKFNNTSTGGNKKSGQDYGMSANMTTTNAWETLTFTIDPGNFFANCTPDKPLVEANEIDMMTFFIAAQRSGASSSNAKYYIKNLRVEKAN